MKKLLKESEIRKMMKFANIGSLSDGFVDKLNEGDYFGEDDALMEEEEDLMEDEFTLEEEEHEDEDPGAEDLDDELPPEGPDELPDEPPADLGDVGGASVEAGLEGLSAFLDAAIAHPDEVKEKVNIELSDDPALDEPALDEPALDEPALDEPVGGDMDALPGPDDVEPEDELEEAQIELEEDDAFVN